MKEFDDKYLYLPKEYWKQHQQCVALISQIEEFVLNDDYHKLRLYPINVEGESDLPKENENILDFLERTGRENECNMVMKNNIIYALIIDTCYFLQEALSCSKKMRLSVSFSLLRKPFVYNLIVFLRIIYEDEFLSKFNTIETFDSTYLTNEKKQELIEMSLSNSLSLKAEHKTIIFDLIFNKENETSIINMSERALHLSTTRNRFNKTGKKNLNFIFSTYKDNIEMWDYLYSKLPLLILYFIEVIDSLVIPIVDLKKEQVNDRLLRRIEIFESTL